MSELEHRVVTTKGVCCKSVEFDYDKSTKKIYNVKFNGGCNGNGKAVASLIDGMRIDEVVSKIGGVVCGNKGTSCAKELSKGLVLIDIES